jgi:hypothetical protein
MSSPRNAGARRQAPLYAAAGVVTLALAAAGSVLAVNPAHGATPPAAPSFVLHHTKSLRHVAGAVLCVPPESER